MRANTFHEAEVSVVCISEHTPDQNQPQQINRSNKSPQPLVRYRKIHDSISRALPRELLCLQMV